ncbi:MAG: hypothetical protein IJM44_00065 [Ruminococcus sp.]|nr:hypothetical protein [Ruminococcus sp.]
MKKIMSLLICGAMMIGTVSCGGKRSGEKPEEPSAPTVETEVQTTDAVTTAPVQTETTVTTTTAVPSVMPPMTSPVEYLDSCAEQMSINWICETYDNMLMMDCVSEAVWAADTVLFIDPVNDEITRTVQLNNVNDSLIGFFSSGSYAVTDYTASSICIYSADGALLHSVDIADTHMDGSFCLDGDCIYCTSIDNTVIKVTESGEAETVYACSEPTKLDRVIPWTANVVIRKPNASDLNPYTNALCSIETGEVLMSVEGTDSLPLQTSDGLVMWDHDWDTGITVFRTAVPEENGGTVCTVDGIDIIQCWSSPDSEYIVCRCLDGEKCDVAFLDPVSGKIAKLGLDLKDTDWTSPCYMRAAKRWFVAVSESDWEANDFTVRLLMAEPELLSFDMQAEVSQPEPEQATQCGAKFSTYRKIANGIEDKYGVRILIGDEVYDAQDDTGYIFSSMEDSFLTGSGDAESDDWYLRNALTELGTVLDMYPDGFFEHFRDSEGKGGLRFVMVDSLSTDMYGSFVPGGISYTYGSWYNIALPYYCFSSDLSDLHHEMWHNVESLVMNRYGFDYEAWTALNPAGFEYLCDFDQYASSELPYGYSDHIADRGNDEDVYFMSDYGLVNEQEDRATIVESLFFHTQGTKRPNDIMGGYDAALRYPHVQEKLAFLGEWIEQEFGYVYWDEMYDEVCADARKAA